MRQFIILTIFFVGAFCYQHVKPHINFHRPIKPYILENEINSTIEGLRPDIPDPLQVEEIDVDAPVEDGADISGNGTITNLDVEGLRGFQIRDLSLNLFGLELNVVVGFSSLHVFTDYDLDLLIENTDNVYGKGNITVDITNAVIKAKGNIDLLEGIKVENLNLDVTVDALLFDIHGLYNDEEKSQEIEDELNADAAKFIDDNQDTITSIISPIFEDILNEVLSSVSSRVLPKKKTK